MSERIRLPHIACLAALGAFLLLGSVRPCAAQTPQGDPGEPEPKDEEAAESKISFHAYLNQAYAVSDGHQVFGIPEQGTTDYRNIALQIRYAISSRDHVVVQLSHERLGRSTINQVRDDLELDWAFYERDLADSTSVKIGKMQLPLGIYNEIRDVGTLLPFYAPPLNFYLENYTSESVEGVMLSHSFAPESDWSLDADLYYGGWDRIEQDPGSGRVVVARAENGVGTQLWLNTPLPDFRVGVAAFRFDVEGRLNQAYDSDTVQAYALSIDGTFAHCHVRAEGIWSELPYRASPEIVFPNLVYRAYYGQLGFDLTPKWSLYLQSDFAQIETKLGLPAIDWNEDHAIGLAYRFRYNAVAKLEVHSNEGFLIENELTFQPVKTEYAILSWATSF